MGVGKSLTEINDCNGKGHHCLGCSRGWQPILAGTDPDEGGHGVFSPNRGHSYFGAPLRIREVTPNRFSGAMSDYVRGTIGV
jgi:hypothetical protein